MLNQCAFFGRLTADPEIRQVGENSVVGKFTIAVERDIPGKDGERGVDFVHCVAWNHLARFLRSSALSLSAPSSSSCCSAARL